MRLSYDVLCFQLIVGYNLIAFLLDAYDKARGKVIEKGDDKWVKRVSFFISSHFLLWLDNSFSNRVHFCFRDNDELFKPTRHDGHIAHIFKISNVLIENMNNGIHKEYLTDVMNGEILLCWFV